MRTSLMILLSLLGLLAACSDSKTTDNAALKELKARKRQTDSLLSDSSLLIFAKVKGGNELIKVENKRYPQDLEATYNVLKNDEDKVIYVAELPYNAANDYFMAYKNYFDENGHLYVFQRLANFFGSGCTTGAAVENLTRYYATDFSPVDSVYTLTDTNKKELDKSKCKFPYNFPYRVYQTLDEYRREKGIKEF